MTVDNEPQQKEDPIAASVCEWLSRVLTESPEAQARLAEFLYGPPVGNPLKSHKALHMTSPHDEIIHITVAELAADFCTIAGASRGITGEELIEFVRQQSDSYLPVARTVYNRQVKELSPIPKSGDKDE